MAFGKAMLPEQGQHLLGQAQQAELVGHRRLGLAHLGGGLLLGEAIDGGEPLQRLGLLPKVQVPPL